MIQIFWNVIMHGLEWMKQNDTENAEKWDEIIDKIYEIGIPESKHTTD